MLTIQAALLSLLAYSFQYDSYLFFFAQLSTRQVYEGRSILATLAPRLLLLLLEV